MASNAERRRPFTTWVKKLNQKMKRTRAVGHSKHATPYPLSGRPPRTPGTADDQDTIDDNSIIRPRRRSSVMADTPDGRPPTTAPSYGTSLAGTNITTALESRRDNDSTFSSPAPSTRSAATAPSTIQSVPHPQAGPSTAGGHGATASMGGSIIPFSTGGHGGHSSRPSRASHGSNFFPTLATLGGASHYAQHSEVQYSAPPALVAANMPTSGAGTPQTANGGVAGGPGGGTAGDRNSLTNNTTRGQFRPSTYSAIIANNLLNDNISILTLASSTQRRKRRSWDTDWVDHASVRALPPASQFGGSRESLPLSVLSAHIDAGGTGTGEGVADGARPRGTARSVAERSISGYTGGHGRADSISGSIRSGLVPVSAEA